jgi:hypothetical protein
VGLLPAEVGHGGVRLLRRAIIADAQVSSIKIRRSGIGLVLQPLPAPCVDVGPGLAPRGSSLFRVIRWRRKKSFSVPAEPVPATTERLAPVSFVARDALSRS